MFVGGRVCYAFEMDVFRFASVHSLFSVRIVLSIYTKPRNVGMLLHDNDVLNFKRKSFVTATKLIGKCVCVWGEKRK